MSSERARVIHLDLYRNTQSLRDVRIGTADFFFECQERLQTTRKFWHRVAQGIEPRPELYAVPDQAVISDEQSVDALAVAEREVPPQDQLSEFDEPHQPGV